MQFISKNRAIYLYPSIQYSNLAGAVKWCSQLALWAALWQVETFGDTLHAAMTMQCMVLTDAYCGHEHTVRIFGNNILSSTWQFNK